jgi:hypothetical protein
MLLRMEYFIFAVSKSTMKRSSLQIELILID